jgi:hypothetical protein
VFVAEQMYYLNGYSNYIHICNAVHAACEVTFVSQCTFYKDTRTTIGIETRERGSKSLCNIRTL